MNIESGIPIPKARRRTQWTPILESMKPGQSIFFDQEKVAQSFRFAGHYRGYKMSLRKIDHGWRVWRTA